MLRMRMIAMVGFMILGCAAAALAGNVEIPSSSTLQSKASGYTTKKGPVTFNHASHMQIACQQCHHTVADTMSFQGCMTDGCHDNLATRTETNSVYRTFHTTQDKNKSCVGCHRDLKKKGKSDAPLACNSCHTK